MRTSISFEEAIAIAKEKLGSRELSDNKHIYYRILSTLFNVSTQEIDKAFIGNISDEEIIKTCYDILVKNNGFNEEDIFGISINKKRIITIQADGHFLMDETIAELELINSLYKQIKLYTGLKSAITL